MPKFVPVADPEAPRWEQDEAKLAKHRNFDSHVVARDQTEQRKLAAGRRAATNADEGRANRGFEQGAVGWGVVGTFGSEARDADAQARPAEGNLKMVQNEKGLWVRAAREEGAVEEAPPRSRSRSRSRGRRRRDRSRSRSRGRRRRDRSRSRSRGRRRRRSPSPRSREPTREDRERAAACRAPAAGAAAAPAAAAAAPASVSEKSDAAAAAAAAAHAAAAPAAVARERRGAARLFV